jgi:hypothetical protein
MQAPLPGVVLARGRTRRGTVLRCAAGLHQLICDLADHLRALQLASASTRDVVSLVAANWLDNQATTSSA